MNKTSHFLQAVSVAAAKIAADGKKASLTSAKPGYVYKLNLSNIQPLSGGKMRINQSVTLRTKSEIMNEIG